MAAPLEPYSAMAPAVEEAATAACQPMLSGVVGKYRWTICALVFFATTINYIDRQVLAILAPTLQKSIGWDDIQYGNILAAFQASYAIGLVTVGGLIDRIGTRRGYALILTLWSIASMGHGLARSVFGFGLARFALGLGEAGNFPAGVKTIAEWFPKRERALATGILNAGSNTGAIAAPILVPIITLKFGWQAAFVCTGALGFLWLAAWLPIYRDPEVHPRLSPAEFEHIRSDPAEPTAKIPWVQLLGYRQTWAFAVGKGLTDPIWWFYLTWTPKFMDTNYHINLKTIGPPLVAIYLMADLGSVAGGWLSCALLKRGWHVNAARKTAMLICALCVVPVMLAAKASNIWLAVLLIGLATAAHQGFSSNLFTLVSDMFPRRAVASVCGIGGTLGAVLGFLFQIATGHIVQYIGYIPIFVMAGSAYLIALLLIQLLTPNLDPPPLD
ncbi:MAG: MFS transporter [Abitibacteriaceae bacterium]|nr:MFS transporter [Abditibacteriaceae bacterium]MBV9867315.1 MFS transporter [Abditibacteriaceae bacterium]